MATGLLLVLVGEGTKLANVLTGTSKTYLATVTFGSATDTLDAEGKTTERTELPPDWLSHQEVDAALSAELLRTEQVPPQVSALKVDGKRAYALARRGEVVQLPPRAVLVKSLGIPVISGNTIEIQLCVSKGYYVRSFARDLGVSLGAPAHLSSLRRIESGGFEVKDAYSLPLPTHASLMSLESIVHRSLPTACLTEVGERKARWGQLLDPQDYAVLPEADADLTAWLNTDGSLVALGHRTSEGQFKVRRGFNSPNTLGTADGQPVDHE